MGEVSGMSKTKTWQIMGRGKVTAAAATALVTALAGCSASADVAADKSEQVKTLRIAPQPIADFAPVWLGIDQGFFASEGLEVSIVEGGASSSAQVPLLLSGKADIAATTAAAAIQAAGQGIAVNIVGGLTNFASDPAADQSALVVASGSTMSGLRDLEGKTVAISGLKSVSEAVISAAVEKAGGDPKKVSFIQAPLPNLADLVASGGADATFLIDPFLSLATAAGLKILGHPFPTAAPGVPGTSLVVASEFAAANPETIAKFRAAMEKSTAYATANPDKVKEALSKEAKIPMTTLAQSKNPAFSAVVDPQQLKVEIDLLTKYGVLTTKVDAAAVVLPN
jgi:NitT/TauT family transport system substrate-binding protein